MNKQNIKTWEDGGQVFKEWADRALDDDDRYADDSIILVASGPDEKSAMTAIVNAYDNWINETRR